MAIFEERIRAIESLFPGSRPEAASDPVPSGAEFGTEILHEGSFVACIACGNLLAQGKPQAVVHEIHNIHRG